jgi:hypothetical protein
MGCQGGTSPGASTRGHRATVTDIATAQLQPPTQLLCDTPPPHPTTISTTTAAIAIMGAALSLPFLAVPAVSTVRRPAACTRVTNEA